MEPIKQVYSMISTRTPPSCCSIKQSATRTVLKSTGIKKLSVIWPQRSNSFQKIEIWRLRMNLMTILTSRGICTPTKQSSFFHLTMIQQVHSSSKITSLRIMQSKPKLRLSFNRARMSKRDSQEFLFPRQMNLPPKLCSRQMELLQQLPDQRQLIAIRQTTS